MFRQSLNRAVLHLRVETLSPLLIKAGDAGLDVAAADMSCVRTVHGRFGRTVYIPGSSLKGVLRSSAEAWLRSSPLRRARGIKGACDPLDHRASCGRRPEGGQEPTTQQVHAAHCLACRVFGSTRMKGRASIRDLYPFSYRKEQEATDLANLARANGTETRHGVAINRVTGAVQHGPFEMEMVPAGTFFYGEIAIENYQSWQLGLLAQAMDELRSGFAQLGSAKSRGLGVVQISIDGLEHEQAARAGTAPVGVGRLMEPAEATKYGLLPESDLPQLAGTIRGLARRFETTDAGPWTEAGLKGLAALEGDS